ncbi:MULTISPECIES: metallophosphoesterase family protein [Halanaerobium]|uniref:DNA repair exonuclease SbcCD nuclease subunit n=1 Tax=Halanaerobium kushneri TaxID=56779 RepID=A0A1N6PC99_9FIRM|nr:MULTISPECIES: DNA repair exonuclease [Halanaerobium]RCW58733.1 DNA repair exonuclease SbcCD nuclease subunit [Halanaerobium sp. ST460_2HS_T2]SIQ02005.1 DNA repair exonuclease SbcCD nuclease subunit [Halanaerobium kushneri]
MPKPIKFIHTADVHLGKELSCNGINNSNHKNLFSNAGKIAFENLVELAVNEEVDFIVVAGDLYDREARSVKASRFFLNQTQFLKEKGIDIYLISGNHDPAGMENEVFELPENVHYFSSEEVEVKEYQKEGITAARIIGQSYRQKFESRTMYNFYTAPDSSIFNIGLLHTALSKDNNHYVPVNKGELLTKDDIDYWALGHLHQYQKINQQPAIYFSGTLQAHNISEEGNKGVILVEVDKNLNSKEKFISLAPVIYLKLKINLEKEGLKNISQLQNLITDEINKMRDKITNQNRNKNFQIKAVIIRLLIEGRTELHQHVENNREELEASLVNYFRQQNYRHYPVVWIHSLIFRTAKTLPDLKSLKNNNPLYQNIKELIEESLTDAELNQELLAEWGQIWQGNQDNEDRENYKFYPEKKLQREILSEVERIIISELIEDGD